MTTNAFDRWSRHPRARVVLTLLPALSAMLATSVATTPAAAAQVHSDAVRVWNLHAVNALINAPTAAVPGAGQPPQVSQLHLAIVHGAIYDAVNSIDGGYQPYLTGLPEASPSASQEAAVATAAHHVLVGLGVVPPPSQVVLDRLNALYADALAAIPDGAAKTDGIAAGAAAAAAMLAARADDGRYGTPGFPVGDQPGQWRPTPPAFGNDPFAWVARVEPFTLQSQSQFRSKGPHALSSRAYAQEYNEVKLFGTASSPRNARQEAVAQFYTVNPVELFNRAFRDHVVGQGLSLAQEARLFAMLNFSAADALINVWDDKAHYLFWRPITAIHEGGNDGNPRTIGDPTWTPLVTTPPYPDHSSGYNGVSGAMMHAALAFFGTDRTRLEVVKIVPGQPNVTRTYRRFTGVVVDTIDARVYQGIHFRAADVQAAKLARDVARWVADNYFQPVS